MIYTSYFYQIRNFKPNMIPVSTALSDPQWYRPELGSEYYVDKRGVINGLRYEPIMVQGFCQHTCPCDAKDPTQCQWMQEYRQLLETLDINAIMAAFEHCKKYVQKRLKFTEEPVIVLIVHEAWHNPCSERAALQDFFNSHGIPCEELKYPIQ